MKVNDNMLQAYCQNKGKFAPVLNQVPLLEDVLGVGLQLHAFLNSALDGG